jgi:hypothetical protein
MFPMGGIGVSMLYIHHPITFVKALGVENNPRINWVEYTYCQQLLDKLEWEPLARVFKECNTHTTSKTKTNPSHYTEDCIERHQFYLSCLILIVNRP